MKTGRFNLACTLAGIMLIIFSCGKHEVNPATARFVFKHNVNGSALEQGVMNYTNKAGNVYQVDELQYFISEIKLKTADAQIVTISSDDAIHYVDLDIPSTLTWSPEDRIPVTDYDSITFVFGINEAKNKTGLFVNPPERDMFWPDMMGGGYHYIKMNGKWKAAENVVKPFNFHLGIGMNMAGTVFYQNYFTVTLPLNVHAGSVSNEFTITMNIEKWFEVPNVWNWNVIGGQIMMNQEAMRKAAENGTKAFFISFSGINKE